MQNSSQGRARKAAPRPPALARAVKYTLFEGARDTRGHALVATDWRSFVADLRQLLAECACDKKDLPAVGPYRLHPALTRSTAAVDYLSLVALDIDRDLPDVAPLLRELRELRLAAVVHGSPSDPAPGSRKVRVYLPATRQIAPVECRAVRRELATTLGVTVDASTLDPARIFFVGRLRRTPQREIWATEGRALDVDVLLEGVKLDPPRAAGRVQTAEDRELTAAEQRALDIAAALLEPHFDPGTRNATAFALGGWLANAGLPPSAADYLVSQLPSEDADARVRDARRAWSAENPAGWSQLAEILPARTLGALEALPLGRGARWTRRRKPPSAWVKRTLENIERARHGQ